MKRKKSYLSVFLQYEFLNLEYLLCTVVLNDFHSKQISKHLNKRHQNND